MALFFYHYNFVQAGCMWAISNPYSSPSLQAGEYGTDEEEDEDEEVSPSYPSAIEVFDLAENEDMSPLETDPEKLAHKYKEVSDHILN